MLSELITAVILIITVIVVLWRRNYGYWKRKNIPYVPGSFPFGSLKDLIFMTDNIGLIFYKVSKKFENAKLIGFYFLWKPMLLVTDPEIIQKILIKDFTSFPDNAFQVNKKVDPTMYLNPFGMRSADDWKNLRNFHRPVYTPNKIKTMIDKLWKTSGNFIKFLKNKNEDQDIYQLGRLYTTDSVAMCAYSLESDSFHDPDSPFVKATSGQLFNSSDKTVLSSFFFPILGRILGFRTTTKAAEDFFVDIGKRCMKHRREQNVQQNDLIQHMVATEDKRSLEGGKCFTNEEIAAACLTFFMDGAETVALQLTTILYEIAANSDVQEKLRAEIFRTGNKIEDFVYEKLLAMEYLDMVISEGQRLHPPIPFFSRICSKDAELDGIKIEKGTKLYIPLLALHRNKKYFPDPDKFDPERFSNDRKSSINKFSFLPFGEGPRICLGMKFAQAEMKMAVVALLLNYKMSLGEKLTGKQMEYDKNSYLVLSFKDQVCLRFNKI